MQGSESSESDVPDGARFRHDNPRADSWDTFLVKIIPLDIEKPIPAGTIIFERDVPSQLHQLLLGKLLAQTRIQIVGNI